MQELFSKKIFLDNKTKDKLHNRLMKSYSFINNLSRVYIWGCGKLGLFVYNQCRRNGCLIINFVDSDKRKWGAEVIDGIKVIEPTELSRDDIVIVATFAYPEIEKKLQELNITKYVYYELVPLLNPGYEAYSQSWIDLWDITLNDMKKMEFVFAALDDDLSREILDNILLYRMTLKSKYINEAYELSLKHGTQYFDECVTLSKDEVFVDCGGFIGDTSEEFIHKCRDSDYKRIYFFEPDGQLLKEAKKKLAEFKDVEFIQAGVGCEEGKLGFKTSANGGGTIVSDGEEMVYVTSLDRCLHYKPTFIKMDIEGFEMAALEGGERVIREARPKLAISIYHKPHDIVEILMKIKSMNLPYRYFIRHYTRTYADTVLYCIPKEMQDKLI